MKRLYYLLTLLCLLCGATPMAAYDFEDGGIYYNRISETAVEVTYSAEYTGVVVIPATASDGANTYDVTSIGMGAFEFCNALTNVTIPASVESIGQYVFNACPVLTGVAILGSTTSIENNAFDDHPTLEAIYVPSESVETYKANENLTDYADKIKSIEGMTFEVDGLRYQTTSFTEVILTGAAEGCSGNIIIPATVSHWINTFAVKIIGMSAFSDNSTLESVIISEGVTNIGWGAFQNCTALKSVSIPESVESIGVNAFLGCTALTIVTVLANMPSIGADAFKNCSALEAIYVPSYYNGYYETNKNLVEYIDKIKSYVNIELKRASIGGGAYASAYLPFSTYLPTDTDVKAYVGASLEDNTLTMVETTEVAAHNGFILHADTPRSIYLNVGATEAAATSIIEGTVTEITLTDDNRADYLVFGVSSDEPKEIGFFKPAASITRIAAYKAFLPNTGDMSAVRMQFDFGTTDIEAIDRSTSGRLQGKNGELTIDNGPLYDLSGRRVTTPAKGGLYIRNGKKIIVND